MKAKRLITGLLASAMIISLFSGCGETKNQSENPAGEVSSQTKSAETKNAEAKSSDTVAEAGKYPLVKDKITLKVFTSQLPQVQNFETNEFTKHMEEKTNVHVEWMLTPKADMVSKVNLLLSSGTDLPDIFLNAVNMGQLGVNGPQGTFVPLNQYIDKYGSGFKGLESDIPDIRSLITFPDGNIYALPKVNDSINVKYNRRLWVYKPWLDKLGLKAPTTTEEYYNVLKAFKEKDPNGNGKADELPMVGYKENSPEMGTGMNFEIPIMNSFVYDDPSPSVERMFLSNGKVDAAYIQEGWKNGLLYFRKLFQEGLIDPVTFTQDEQAMKKLNSSKDSVKIGSTIGPNLTKVVSNPDLMFNYENVAPLKGPDGTQQNYYRPLTIQHGHFIITKNCKYPDVAYRWGDTMLNEEESTLARLGVKGKDWTDAGENDVAPNGEKALYKSITVWGTEQNSNWYLNGLFWNKKYEGKDAKGSKLDGFIYPIAVKQSQYVPKEVLPILLFTADESQQVATYVATIRPYVEQTFAEFCLDKNLDVEKKWNSYISELKKMGVDDLVKIYQTAYDRQIKNSKK